jgi:Na+-translocating ferredoxin:NAD+ oxidoreductase RnfG subunit
MWGTVVALLTTVPPVPLAAQGGTMTQDQALDHAFPEAARFERRTAYLDEAQVNRARALAGATVEMESRVVTYYEAVDRDGRLLGSAWFDAHRVRTLPEVLMIVLNPEGRVETIEVLRFSEPPEYAPAPGWLAQFEGRVLDDDLSLKRGIVGVTGATLTANAVTDAARRVLALSEVIGGGGRTGS